jgi:hypothetical protein
MSLLCGSWKSFIVRATVVLPPFGCLSDDSRGQVVLGPSISFAGSEELSVPIQSDMSTDGLRIEESNSMHAYIETLLSPSSGSLCYW